MSNWYKPSSTILRAITHNTRNELVKKLLETKLNTSKELELLFGMKFSDDDNAGEFNKILSLNSVPKSIDIKA
ncbi:Uncharacterised protein [Campylobacter jejuni subsp. doylei]|nr:Uncharacterised protein [Campylobacter jejuni subsp. doylei]